MIEENQEWRQRVYIDKGIRDYQRFTNLRVVAVDTNKASFAAAIRRLQVQMTLSKKK